MISIIGYGTLTGMKTGTTTNCLVGQCSECGHNLIVEWDMKCIEENCQCECTAYLAIAKVKAETEGWRQKPCLQIN